MTAFADVRPASIRARLTTAFPASVTASSPIILTKENGHYHFALEPGSTDVQAPITVTTTGTGAATFFDNVLNIPPSNGGDVSSNTSTSVNSELALFSGTGGKTIKRATGSGIPKLASGVLGFATAGTDYQLPISLTTTAPHSAATFSGNVLNIPHIAFVNVLDYGADPTYTSDNVTAFLAALNALPSRGGTVYVPPGKYKFNSQLVYTIGANVTTRGIRILGAGQASTQFVFPSNSGFLFQTPGEFGQHTLSVSDCDFIAGTTSSGTALAYVNTGTIPSQFVGLSTFERITIMGVPSLSGDAGVRASQPCWYIGLDFLAIQNVNVNDCLFQNDWHPDNGHSPQSHGIGCRIRGSSSSNFGLLYNFQGCNFYHWDIHLYYGEYVQGVTVNQCNFNGATGTAGIWIGTPGPSDVLQALLAVSNSQFAAGRHSIWATAFCFQISITGCVCTQVFDNDTTILLEYSDLAQITANSFNSNQAGTVGVWVKGIGATTIIGNTFTNHAFGYIFDTGTNYCKGQSNSYQSVTTPYTNSGSSITPGTPGP